MDVKRLDVKRLDDGSIILFDEAQRKRRDLDPGPYADWVPDFQPPVKEDLSPLIVHG
jgi:hypothetical protein